METSWIKTYLTSLILVLVGGCLFVSGYNETLLATPYLKDDLLSPGYLFNLDYGPNVTYDYLVETNYVNHTITLTMLDCEIESDKNGACYYDHLYIYDGPNSSYPLLDDFCCQGSMPSYTTTGKWAYLSFETDADRNYKGFKMSYMSFGVTTTTTTSTTTTTAATTTTTTTTTTPAPTAASTEDGGGNSLYIIIGCAVGGFLILLLLIILIVCCLLKSKRPITPEARDTKRVLWSRNSMVKAFQASPRHLPPGSVTQTNIFEMDLPDHGRGNQLPPLSSKLGLPAPAIDPPPYAKPF